MKKAVLLAGAFLGFVLSGTSQNPKIRVFFNQAVNTGVSTGVKANYLPSTFPDTIAAYINKAKLTVDIAQYDFTAGTELDVISAATNAARARGVIVRWIGDGTQANTGWKNGNLTIGGGQDTLSSPIMTGYIMHNKFMIIDANSTTTTAPWVLTGSDDWGASQSNTCFNNLVAIQDQNVAKDYTTEFEQMWGGTGPSPVPANSKWSTKKTASAVTSYNVNGTVVDVYFSPMDKPVTQLLAAMNTAKTDLFFGIYTFTDNSIATQLITQYKAGINVRGMIDSYSVSTTSYPNAAYNTVTAGLPAANWKVYNGVSESYIYHNKTMLIDAMSPGDAPQVWTGSYNWSEAGSGTNDENSVLIHDATVTNEYYQSFCQNFTALGGVACTALPTGIEENNLAEQKYVIYPNPFSDGVTIKMNGIAERRVIKITDQLGKNVLETSSSSADEINLPLSHLSQGIYFVSIASESGTDFQKIVK
jgi:phosphatidylserine/phosphatidylglycerophosphate/cardiolipin synthase-like enzyme